MVLDHVKLPVHLPDHKALSDDEQVRPDKVQTQVSSASVGTLNTPYWLD